MSNVLHYPGDRTRFDPDQTLGPDRFGACYAPVAATYDAATDRTTMQLRPLPPAELTERRKAAIAQQAERQRIATLFGGTA